MNQKKITIVGAGYVGLSLGVLLSRTHEVTILEKDLSRVANINNKQSYLDDKELTEILGSDTTNLYATDDISEAYQDRDYIILAVPTNFEEQTSSFDTSILNSCIKDALSINKNSIIFIKSTVPIGFTREMRKRHDSKNIYFSPEFLREGNAVSDNLNPGRIVVGGNDDRSEIFSKLILSIAENEPEIIITGNSEAEAIKLFSNTYLAMRVAFFNELDTFTMINNLDSKSIINGMGLDKRIGNIYCNPSFGYGGYCLPKDSRQLQTQFINTPNSLITSIVKANEIRKKFLVDTIISSNPSVVGIFRLIMKEGSDNFREAAILDIIQYLKEKNRDIVIYEPYIEGNSYQGIEIIKSLDEFKEKSSIIIANRSEDCLKDCESKVFSRDKFGDN